MDLLSLPVKIFDVIIEQAVKVRTLARGVRLRLVSKRFADAVLPALLRTGHLHRVDVLNNLDDRIYDWPLQKHHGAEAMWHRCLVYHVLNERNPGFGRYVEVRQVAQAYCQITGEDIGDIVDKICWLDLIAHDAPFLVSRAPWARASRGQRKSAKLDLLCMATYLGNVSMCKQLLRGGRLMQDESTNFPPALYLAGYSGNERLLELLLAHACDTCDGLPPEVLSELVHIPAMLGACVQGDLALVRGVLRRCPESGDIRVVRHVLSETLSVDIFKHLYGLHDFSSPGEQWILPELLSLHCARGNMAMVHHLLSANTGINGRSPDLSRPLAEACYNSHEDIFDLILGYAQSVNHRFTNAKSPLIRAAFVGNSRIVHKLLHFGFEATDEAIMWAFRAENTAMVELLLSRAPESTLVELEMSYPTLFIGRRPGLDEELVATSSGSLSNNRNATHLGARATVCVYEPLNRGAWIVK